MGNDLQHSTHRAWRSVSGPNVSFTKKRHVTTAPMTNRPDAMDDLQTVEMRAASLVTVKTQKDRACGSNGCDAFGTLGHPNYFIHLW